MNALIDTSSLLAFVRYYLPFDKDGHLRNFLEKKYESGEIIVLDKVVEESKYVSQGIIVNQLDFLVDWVRSKKVVDTKWLLPKQKFFNMLDNQFCNKSVLKLKGLSEIEFEQEKNNYLEGADAKLLLVALDRISENSLIVTEETSASNDNKIFRKIPDNCKAIGIGCCALPVLLSEHFGIDFGGFVESGLTSDSNVIA